MSLIEYGYKHFVRPRIFAASDPDAEIAHEWGLAQLKTLQQSPIRLAVARSLFSYYHPMLFSTTMGLPFRNPLGLAGGFDKYCEIYHTAVPATGWGFAEVGGITPLPQVGTRRTPDNPRLRRSVKYQALWNQMGFNNPGKDIAVQRLQMFRTNEIPIGANIGKGKDTPLDRAHEDYCAVIEAVGPFVDFLVINVSSPNTKDLRKLQARDFLLELATKISTTVRKPALLGLGEILPWGFKISPDETDHQVTDILDISLKAGAKFVIACNTTTSRVLNLEGWNIPADRGGLSGERLRHRSRQMLKDIYRQVRGRMSVVSVGGINSFEEFYQRILLGASLCQVYTAWPFEGPDMCKRWLRELVDRLKSDGFKSVSDAIGAYQ